MLDARPCTAYSSTVCMQVRFQLEQTREGLQRQLAATDGQMHVLQARLEDSKAEQQVHLNSVPLPSCHLAFSCLPRSRFSHFLTVSALSLVHAIANSCTRSYTHSLTHPPTHSLAHSLTCLVSQTSPHPHTTHPSLPTQSLAHSLSHTLSHPHTTHQFTLPFPHPLAYLLLSSVTSQLYTLICSIAL